VQGSRFIFLLQLVPDESGEPADEILTWMLVSPNHRPLGRAATYFASDGACRAAALGLRAQAGRVQAVAAVGPGGHWVWRVDLDGVTAAVSTRTYLRQQECHYSLRRFREALPVAELATGVRTVRSGRSGTR
jgi:hypothetical protein